MFRRMYRWFVSLFRSDTAEQETVAPPPSLPPEPPVVVAPPPPVVEEPPVVVPPTPPTTTPVIPSGRDAIDTLWTYVTRPVRFARKVDPAYITRTLESLDTAFVVDLDGRMRNQGPFASTWHDAQSLSDLDVLGLPPQTLHVLAAMHPSGRIRERGLRRIAETDMASRSRHALSCTLLRLNDWVEQVRDVARESIDDMLVQASIDDWADAFPSLVRLRRAQRYSHDDLYREATARLAREPRSDVMRRHVELAPPHVAQNALTVRLHQQSEDASVLVETGMRRPEARVRRSVVRTAARVLKGSVVDRLLDRAEIDPCENIRLLALTLRVQGEAGQAAEASLRRLVADPSPLVRAYCQRELLDRGVSDLAALYREAGDQALTSRQLAAALKGLAEVGAVRDASYLVDRVQDKRALVRASAVAGLGALKPIDADEVFLNALSDESPRVSKTALSVLCDHPHMIAATRIRRLARSADIPHVRKHALEALLAKGNWAPLASLIEYAATNQEAQTKEWVAARFRTWRTAHDSWTEAPQREVETDFTKAFETHAARLEPSMRKEVSFLLDALDSRRYIE